ncbi:MAG TPA: hypothetical protein RMH99_20415, partial [Sandaracinaceae bacterium LLY-WYZ-13_1]|nr:hypothetical protein [Sandaracinaceae bacterium LLY-WYZ-13_1]
ARTLHVVPVVHDEADLGRLGQDVKQATMARGGATRWHERQAAVERAWTAIEAWARDLEVEGVHLFQDGLPVCGKEAEIVRDLAARGSRNHRLLQALVERGGRLEGTESPELLLAEYEHAQQVLAGEGPAPDEAAGLLGRRDAFIAALIDEVLPAGGTAILFVGALHDVAAALAARKSDIEVRHPLGRPGTPGDDHTAAARDASGTTEGRTA